jgi:prevent-host-death family protein
MQGATPYRDAVGVRELRDNLSRYLERVKAGTEVVVTEHGVPIAYLVARPRSSRLADLIANGRARAPLTYRRVTPEPVEFDGTGQELDQLIRNSR